MNAPNFHTRVLGNIIVGPVTLATTAFVTFLWWQNGCEGIIGFLTIGMFAGTLDAMKKVATWKEWRADWDGMAPGGRRQGINIKSAALLIVLAGIGVFVYFASQPDAPPELRTWLKWATIAGTTTSIAIIGGRIGCWLWRRFRGNQEALVTVASTKPVVQIATLAESYQRLPDYCQHLLKGRS